MKRRIMAFLLSFAMILTMAQPLAVNAEETSGYDYEVITPDGYDDDHAYPVIYVMPEDGYAQDDSGITEKLQDAMADGTSTKMIIVEPSFDAETDLYAAMDAIVAEVDAEYNTIADADHRVIAGTGVGGYLAYILGLTEAGAAEETPEEVPEEVAAEDGTTEEEPVETINVATLTAPKLFKYVASTRGDFVSEANGWNAAYGDVYTYMTEIGGANLANFFTYADAPVADEWSDMEGSTNDIGQLIISNGTDAAACEFTTRLGEFTDEFLTEAVNRIANRATNGMLGDAVSGTVALKETVLAVDAATFEVDYTVNTTDVIAAYSSVTENVEIIVEVIDPSTGEVLTSESVVAEAAETIEGTVELEKNIPGASAAVTLAVNVLGARLDLATATALNVRETVVDGDNQFIDLMGDWYFHYIDRNAGAGYDMIKEDVESGAYTEWSVVQPGLAWWTLGFGDLTSRYGTGAWADYGFIGEGWYVRTFEVPENFDAEDLIISIGNLDDRGQAFINGTLVGETGMTNGEKNQGESAWEEYSYYEIDPSILNIGGTNTIVVRCFNDGAGGGGWYSGPVALYSQAAFEADDSTVSMFVEQSFDSEYAASAQGLTGTVENDYLIYLPDSYYESDRYYPTVYLLHQYNSTHKSYMTDDVDRLLNAAAKEGVLDEMIVVVPNSDEVSWWRGDWMKMVTEELVPLIDSEYRTIDDARYRFTAGCSMGGQGAYGVALTNPDLFSGAISFFGAFSMGGDASPNTVAENESAAYLDYFAMYFICGNQDIYKFGDPAVELHQQLLAKGVDHEFFIENGGHDSTFYLPHFIEGFEYVRNNMYQSPSANAIAKQLEGALSVNSNGVLKVTFEAAKGIENYFNAIPASSYTLDTTPDLSVPVIIEIAQGDEVTTIVERDFAINKTYKAETFKYDVADFVKADYEYTVTYKVAVFDQVIELDSIVVNEGNVYEGLFDDVTAENWYYDAVEYVAENGIMQGTSKDTFDPDGTLTREQFATVIYRFEGEPEVDAENPFTDVVDGEWYADAVIWASENGIVNGTGNGKFGVGKEITREAMAAMLHRYIVWAEYKADQTADISGYVDAADVSSWAVADMEWSVGAGIITGNTKNELNPQGDATRAECATILMRLMETFE